MNFNQSRMAKSGKQHVTIFSIRNKLLLGFQLMRYETKMCLNLIGLFRMMTAETCEFKQTYFDYFKARSLVCDKI